MNRHRLLLAATFIISSAAPLLAAETSPEKKPHKILKVLVVDGFNNHDWKHTTAWVKGQLESDGRFNVQVSTAPPTQKAPGWDTWRPEFSNYDVVIQNCNSHGGRPSWPREVQSALEKYVASGGGLYILHSANNAFPKWKEYNKMIGLGWRGKNFGFAIKIDDQGKTVKIPPGEGGGTGHGKRLNAVLTRIGQHPIHQGFPRKWMAADLEIYRYARGPAENLTVISYAYEPSTKLNFPIEWTVRYGKGRVYNSTFGHIWKNSEHPDAVRCVAFQTILPRVVEWLATGKVTTPVPKDFPTAEKVKLR